MFDERYEILKERSKTLEDGTKVYQIRALRKFCVKDTIVEKGELGGFIESAFNLTRFRNCWVFENSIVYGNARVMGDAAVLGESIISGNATVCDFCTVIDSFITDDAVVCENSIVLNSIVANNAVVAGSARLVKSKVWNDSHIYKNEYIDSATIDEASGGLAIKYPKSEKYALIPQHGEFEGLFRLIALKDIDNHQCPTPIKVGDLGGIVAGFYNLATTGSSWIGYESKVIDRASVFDRAYVGGKSTIENDTVVCGKSSVVDSYLTENAFVGAQSKVENVYLDGRTRVVGAARIVGEGDTKAHFKSKDDTIPLRVSHRHEVIDFAEVSQSKF